MSLKGEIPSVAIAVGLDKEKLQEWMRARQAAKRTIQRRKTGKAAWEKQQISRGKAG